MTRIDFAAREVQFVDHLAPVYLALPPEHRGDFLCHHGIRGRASEWGITAVPAVEHLERPLVVASYGDQKAARRSSRRTIARIEHGAGQSYFGDAKFGGHASYAGGRDCEEVGLFLCPNEYSAERWRAAYPRTPVEVVGCPKLDFLPTRVPGKLTIAIGFHFDIDIIPETRSAFAAYRPILESLAKRYVTIAHGHPKGIGLVSRYFVRAGMELVPSFADVCRRADLYICDNSSTLFEFAATGRPVLVLNDPGFRLDMHHGGRFWDWAGVGINVWSPDDLIPAIERALEDPEAIRAAREAVLAQVYPIRTGAAQRAAVALLAWAGVGQAVAA